MNASGADLSTAAPLIVFLVTLLLMPAGIRRLTRLKFGQNVREDGPEAHRGKSGTPTMGGVIFVPIALLGYLITVLLWGSQGDRIYCFTVCGFTLLGLAIGALDDYRSIRSGGSLGLKAREKLLLQFVSAGLFLAGFRLLWDAPSFHSGGAIGGLWRFGWWYGALLAVFVVWIINAANIADGLDGLAGAQAIVALGAIAAWGDTIGVEMPSLPVFVMIAALAAFLCFNAPPARIFMGDAGSIAVGCFIAGMGLLYMPVWLLALATAVWSLEALSVVIQVIYFKLTGGKRIFRMAPIHHHFELGGWAETRVTAVFVIASLVLAVFVPMAIGALLR